jgi:hypothetical protein
MKLKRNHFFLQSIFGEIASAGAAALHAVESTIQAIEVKLHLRHAETGQECEFDDQSALDNFVATVPDADKWAAPGQDQMPGSPAPDAPAGKFVEVDLNALQAAVAADAADAAAPEAPATEAEAPAAAEPAAPEAPAADTLAV